MRIIAEIKYWFSELSGFFQILIFGLILFAISEVATGFFGKKYYNPHPNTQSYTLAVKEFKSVCGRCTGEADDNGVEYSVYFDSKGEAINGFMTLAHRLNNTYSNGRFRHCYISGKERIYQCKDKHKNLIALRYIKYRAMPLQGKWKPLYCVQLYVEKEREN